MPTEQEWLQKYREALSRLAAEEAKWSKTQNVVKLLIGRLCLAAQGRHEQLDREVARVAEVARKQIDAEALDIGRFEGDFVLTVTSGDGSGGNRFRAGSLKVDGVELVGNASFAGSTSKYLAQRGTAASKTCGSFCTSSTAAGTGGAWARGKRRSGPGSTNTGPPRPRRNSVATAPARRSTRAAGSPARCACR